MNSDIKAVNELKMLAIDMINKAKSGSPGICLDMAPVMYTLFAKVLNVYPKNPNFFNRDRVILSSSHIAPLYYAMLHMAGYAITKEDLMNFKRYNSITPGLPEYKTTVGVEASTGYAGDGVGIAVGEALAQRYINATIRSEDEKLKILDYSIFCFCSDADIMSGATYEAFEFAAVQNLERLVFLYDANNMGEDGPQNGVMIDNTIKKFQGLGFYVDVLKDPSNIREITKALLGAQSIKKPALLIFKNTIGQDSFNSGKNILHAGALSHDDTENMRKRFGSILEPFEVSKDSQIHVQNQIVERTKKIYNRWNEHYNRAKGLMNININQILYMLEQNYVDISFDSANYKINDGYRETLIESNGKIMNIFANKTPLFLGGSAAVSLASRTILNISEFQSSTNQMAKNIRFGVRERAMANILNGMSLLGLRVFGSTKLCYYDECKSGIRMSALMNLPVTYIFTHDSLYDSEDGPARIPSEQLAALRSTPNLTVYRPADINEVMGSWEVILKNSKPAALVLSRNNIPKLPGSNSKEVIHGGYIIKREVTRLDGIIIATGSEVVSALQIAYDLANTGLDIRVVSMPSLELFNQAGEEYKKMIVPKDVKTIVMEAGSKMPWYQFVSDDDYIISIDDFAYSGVTLEVLQQMNYDYESLKLKVESLMH